MKLFIKKFFYVVFSIICTLFISAISYKNPIFELIFERDLYRLIALFVIALLCVVNFVISYRYIFPLSEEDLIDIEIKKYEIREIEVMLKYLKKLLFILSNAFNEKQMQKIDIISRKLKVGIMSGKNSEECNTELNELRQVANKTQLDFDEGYQAINRIQAFISKSSYLSDRAKIMYSNKAKDSQMRLDEFYDMYDQVRKKLK